MKKMLYKLMAVCMLGIPFAAVAQSTDNMKQDQSQRDQVKHDDMGQDQTKKDDTGKDEMKGKKGKKGKKGVYKGEGGPIYVVLEKECAMDLFLALAQALGAPFDKKKKAKKKDKKPKGKKKDKGKPKVKGKTKGPKGPKLPGPKLPGPKLPGPKGPKVVAARGSTGSVSTSGRSQKGQGPVKR